MKNSEIIEPYFKGKTVLVTGAGGSIGSALVKQLVQLPIKQVISLGHSEEPLHQLTTDLINLNPPCEYLYVLADVRDKGRMEAIINHCQPDIIFHVAAVKHVPIAEKYPAEALHTNVIGTKIIADAAKSQNVLDLVFVSTDKAVKPSGVMGATKRVAELYIGHLGYKVVRFGNVLDTSGSIVPLFKKQIAEGKPIMITHPDIARYFMAITQATDTILLIPTLQLPQNIYVPLMGQPQKIMDIARKMVKESKKNIRIEVGELRPGEKMSESLFYSNETLMPTRFKLNAGRLRDVDEAFLNKFNKAEQIVKRNNALEIYTYLHKLLGGEYENNRLLSTAETDHSDTGTGKKTA